MPYRNEWNTYANLCVKVFLNVKYFLTVLVSDDEWRRVNISVVTMKISTVEVRPKKR